METTERKKPKRTKTRFPGVCYIFTQPSSGKPEKVYYILYWKDGRKIEEKAGREGEGMNAAKASRLRGQRIDGGETNKERRDRERAERIAAREAKKAEEGRMTFNRLWEEWKKNNADNRGLYRDDTRYGKHIKGPFGEKEPNALVPLDVDRLKLQLLKKEYAPDTVISVISLLSRIANYGVRKQLCPGLSFRIEKGKDLKRKDRTETLTEEQMARYIKVCKEWPDPQAGNFQLLMLLTGMRRGEAEKLRWSDVNLEQGFLTILDPKGGKDAIIPLSDAALELLRNHPRVSEHVFARKDGGPRSRRQMEYSSIGIKKAAGLPEDFRPSHGLRHTFASALASSGQVTLYEIQKLLTHKSPQMTQRYEHLADEALKRSANVMGKIAQDAERTEIA